SGLYSESAAAIPRTIQQPPGVGRASREAGDETSPIYVAAGTDNYVQVLELNRLGFVVGVAKIPTGDNTIRIAAAPDSRALYATNYKSSTESIIDPVSNTVAGAIQLPSGSKPYGIAVSRDSSQLYITGDTSPRRVFVVDIATRALVTTIPVGNRPMRVAISPDGTLAYVANNASDTVTVIDTLTNMTNATVPLKRPLAILFDYEGVFVYISTGDPNGMVTKLDVATNPRNGLGYSGRAVPFAGSSGIICG
ncbi:MAG: hypothetical protein ABI995_10120, partial [Acidobacteriota bacterium]